MDWRSVAGLLAERDQPVLLLDRAGRIMLFNGAMERALLWQRDEARSYSL
jgi:PAS domain-containing protein